MKSVHDSATAFRVYSEAFSKVSDLLTPMADVLCDGNKTYIVEEALTETMRRLSYTGAALNCKYGFSHASLAGAPLGIGSNGFPYRSEIDGMHIDLTNLNRENGLLMSVEVLKRAWINSVLETGSDNAELLWRIGERRYLDLIDQDKMFLPIFAGNVYPTNKDKREYVFWWTSYSHTTNSPVVHILEFTQDVDEDIGALHERGPELAEFLQVIRSEGQRTPPVNLHVHNIDSNLLHIHPVRLTRITFDRLFASKLTKQANESLPEDSAAEYYYNHLADSGDLILKLSVDLAISKGAKHKVKALFGTRKSCQVFREGVDPKSMNRGSSQTKEYIFVPHRLAQLRESDEHGPHVEPLFDMIDQVITYTNGGQVNAI